MRRWVGRRVGLDMELNMGIIAEVVMVEVRLVLLKSSLNGLVRGAVMGVQVNIQGGVVPVFMVRGEGVVREGEVIINEEGIMRRHHNTPELGGEDGGHWGRGWWRGRGVTREVEAGLVILEMLHHPGHDVIRELAGGQCAAERRVAGLRGVYLLGDLSPVQQLVIPSPQCVSKDIIETAVRGKQPSGSLAATNVINARKA